MGLGRVVGEELESQGDAIQDEQGQEEAPDPALQGVPWEKFNEEAYLSKKALKPGEDKYIRNKFNQEASDAQKSNRHVPDTRNRL